MNETEKDKNGKEDRLANSNAILLGINAFDLIESPDVSSNTFTEAVALLEANYGTTYSREKTALLFDMIRDEGWSEERFKKTLKWFIKNKPYPAWTISDWFSFGVKVYTYSWCLKKVSEGWSWKNDIESYKLPNGLIVYKPRDGEELPFDRRF